VWVLSFNVNELPFADDGGDRLPCMLAFDFELSTQACNSESVDTRAASLVQRQYDLQESDNVHCGARCCCSDARTRKEYWCKKSAMCLILQEARVGAT
jgi:hypothetical protein